MKSKDFYMVFGFIFVLLGWSAVAQNIITATDLQVATPTATTVATTAGTVTAVVTVPATAPATATTPATVVPPTAAPLPAVTQSNSNDFTGLIILAVVLAISLIAAASIARRR